MAATIGRSAGSAVLYNPQHEGDENTDTDASAWSHFVVGSCEIQLRPENPDTSH